MATENGENKLNLKKNVFSSSFKKLFHCINMLSQTKKTETVT